MGTSLLVNASHIPLWSEFPKLNNVWLYLQIACFALPLIPERLHILDEIALSSIHTKSNRPTDRKSGSDLHFSFLIKVCSR